MKIAVVTSYFGKEPNYFQLWLDSCGWNPTITWLLYSDIDLSKYVVPRNVINRQTSFDEFKAKLQAYVDFPIRYTTAWDFCANRGGIGVMFQEELQGFDYWGWCDQDVIYGDLGVCLRAAEKGADKIMPKGHLSFVKNEKRLNEFIFNHPLTRIAMDARQQPLPCFDEVGLREVVLRDCSALQDDSIPFLNTACRLGHYRLCDVRALTDELPLVDVDKLPFVATLRNGRMFGHFAMPNKSVRTIEVVYFHFFRRDLVDNVGRLSKDAAYIIKPNDIGVFDGHELAWREICRLDHFRIHWAYFLKRLTAKRMVAKLSTLFR